MHDQDTVCRAADVELDAIGTKSYRSLERRDRVFVSTRAIAAVSDDGCVRRGGWLSWELHVNLGVVTEILPCETNQVRRDGEPGLRRRLGHGLIGSP
jgi:hypothetical protein